MSIYPTTFRPAGLKKGCYDKGHPWSSDYVFASQLLSNIEANMGLSESVDEIAGCFCEMFPDVSVSKEGTGRYSFTSTQGNTVRISENESGEISLDLGRVRKAEEPPLDITELGPEIASEYIMAVLGHGHI